MLEYIDTFLITFKMYYFQLKNRLKKMLTKLKFNELDQLSKTSVIFDNL